MAMTAAAESMDRMYRLQRHVYDLTRKYYLLGRDRMIAGLDVPDGGTVLELGCGTARNLIVAARRYPSARLFGIDISAEMLRTAEASIVRTGLGNRLRIAQGDATSADPGALFGVERFDRVFISYSLSMIAPWREALEHGARLLGEQGELHVVDFGQGERLPPFFNAGLKAWLARFHVTPREGLEAAMREAAAKRGMTLRFARPFGGYAQMGVIRRG
jgi:S-adenosylmethionine-diacylgycerolhomoserine-N-methlytransferase